jgi:ketosteroid isomerase-like protein
MTTNPEGNREQEIIDLEQRWNRAIQRQDAAKMANFLAPDYFLAIGTQGLPLQIMPKETWLAVLPAYVTEILTFDDLRVHVYGETAVVLMLPTQKATVRGQDRSGQFVITDV